MGYATEWNKTGIWDSFLCKILIFTPNLLPERSHPDAVEGGLQSAKIFAGIMTFLN